MKGYIYITTNLINNKKYIGKRVDSVFREWYLGSGIYLKNAISKYGKENFEVKMIDNTDNLNELDKMEIEYIKRYNAVESDDFYNIHPGGTGFMWGEYNHMKKPEYKKIFSEMFSGEKNPMYKSGERGVHPKGFLGKHHSKETRKIQSFTMKKVNDLGLNTNWKNGHPKGMLGKNQTDNQKEKVGNGRVQIIYPNGDVSEHLSLTTASKETGIPRNVLRKIEKDNKPYVAPKNFHKTHSIYNGIIIKKIDNTEVTYEVKIS